MQKKLVVFSNEKFETQEQNGDHNRFSGPSSFKIRILVSSSKLTRLRGLIGGLLAINNFFLVRWVLFTLALFLLILGLVVLRLLPGRHERRGSSDLSSTSATSTMLEIHTPVQLTGIL